MTDKRYLTVAETATLIRKKLAKSFPGTKFYVRSKSYAGGASIDVYYDGLDRWDPPVTCVDHGLRSPGDWCAVDGVFRWTPVYKPGAPTKGDVEAITDGFSGRGFDGMIDLAYGITAFLNARGEIVGTGSYGSAGSGGYVPAWGPADVTGLTPVSFGASYVFVNDTLPYDVRTKGAA